MAYPDPSTIDMTNPMNLIYYINNNSDQLFGMGIISTIWLFVLIGYFKTRDDIVGALAVSFFVAWIIGLLGWISNFIPAWFFGIITALTIVTALILFSDRGNS